MSEKNHQKEEVANFQHASEWLNDNGHPSYSYLMKLAEEDTVESRDELMELAERYDIPRHTVTTTQDLVEKIMLYMNMGQEAV